jgi:hypothetical protein
MVTLFKIDPYLETIYPVEVSETLTDICQQIGARRLTVAGQQSDQSKEMPGWEVVDAAYCDEEAIQADLLPPSFRLRSSGHVIYGCALWHRVNEQGQVQTPAWSLSELSAQVEFLGFYPLASVQPDTSLMDDENLPLDESEGD